MLDRLQLGTGSRHRRDGACREPWCCSAPPPRQRVQAWHANTSLRNKLQIYPSLSPAAARLSLHPACCRSHPISPGMCPPTCHRAEHGAWHRAGLLPCLSPLLCLANHRGSALPLLHLLLAALCPLASRQSPDPDRT